MAAAWFFFILGAAAVFYFLIGYPVVLAIGWRGRRNPVAKDLSFTPRVSLVMAVHNGAAFLRNKLETIFALDYPKELIEIIVLSDGSMDETVAIASEYSDRVQAIAGPRRGKAATVNLGVERATGEIVFFTDVRQPLDPMALRHLVANFADPKVGAVTGELKIRSGDRGQHADMDLYWRYELWARTQHSHIDSIFTATGCLYAMRRNLIEPIPADTLSDDAYLPLRAFFRGYRVVFDPQAVAYDYPSADGTEFRRRCRTLGGLWQLFARLPELFTSRNRMRFHFLSYKFSRLMLPWAALMMIGATLALPKCAFREMMIAGYLAFAAIAIVDRFVPRRIALKRLTSPAWTFVAMNAASIAALAVFVRPPQRLWVATQVETAGRESAPL